LDRYKLALPNCALFDLEDADSIPLRNLVDMAHIHTMQNPKDGTNNK
jgi:hypothetical protein